MKKLIGLLFLLMLMVACTPPQTDREVAYSNSEVFDHNWAMDVLWEDGQAEVAHYQAEREIYGKVRSFDYAFITVKEEFNEAFNVKTDDYNRSDLFSVMKVNKFARIETDNYPYHYLTSLFYKREQPEQLYKMTHTGQEWCGNTFKQFTLNPSGYSYNFNSYFDGSGHGETSLSGTDMLWEDQLSYLLRALQFEDGLQFQKQVVESQINTKVRTPKVYEAKFSVVEKDSLWQVEVKLEEDKVNTYTFDKTYPNLMLSQESWDGQKLKLKEVSRYKYWR